MSTKPKEEPTETLRYGTNAPNKPDVEMYNDEYLCAWCKKLFKTEIGRRNHSTYCRWNPSRIKKVKATRKRNREIREKVIQLHKFGAPNRKKIKVKLETAEILEEDAAQVVPNIDIKSEAKTEPIE